tara:strand:+ start:266 stop:946 length:681 start_codon:yes stop_codon:yes gene_type:complete
MGLKEELQALGDEERANLLQRFFKTGPGEYGEGDKFLGVVVPETRKVAKKYLNLDFNEIEELLQSGIHEVRLAALLILVERYKKTKDKEIVDFYLKNTKYINNWDLVDLTAHKILGDYLLDRDKEILYSLAESSNLWERRISIISTFAFIDEGRFEDSLKISEILLNDEHDLIHKAVGWVLREIGKKDLEVEEEFLRKYHKEMPRTMLRYSIEKFSEEKRKFYMKK